MPYALPRLLAEVKIEHNLEPYLQMAIRASWKATRGSRTKCGIRAAREAIALWRLTPAKINAMALALYDYNAGAWPTPEEAKKLDWLYVGAGCTMRMGTDYDAHISAWGALYAAMSILVEVAFEHQEDEEALLRTLAYVRWRVPNWQRKQVAQRFARYVAACLEGNPWRLALTK